MSPMPKPDRFDSRATSAQRRRGRSGVEQRKRRLRAEPLCRHCEAVGRVSAATVPDHIIPLKDGGTDDDSNIQCLCEQCHAIKTADEAAQGTGAANHPEWLRPSAISLTIVCGPPCAGKTTFVKEHAAAGDMVIDLDSIAARIRPTYRHWEGMLDADLLNKSIRSRNELLGYLSRAERGAAWFIVSAPTSAERKWWQSKLGGQLILLDPGHAECKRRAEERGTPKAKQGITDWYRKAALPWQPRRRKQEIGADGWPLQARN